MPSSGRKQVEYDDDDSIAAQYSRAAAPRGAPRGRAARTARRRTRGARPAARRSTTPRARAPSRACAATRAALAAPGRYILTLY